MKVLLTAAALAISIFSIPVHAAIFVIAYSANVNGTQSVYDPSQIGCAGQPASSVYCTGVGPYSETISGTITLIGSTPVGNFGEGNSRSPFGFRTGTIIGSVTQGISGINFTIDRDQAGGTFFQHGTAATFTARLVSIDEQPAPAPVPEPATWAITILGFGAIGWSLRRANKPARNRRVRVRAALA